MATLEELIREAAQRGLCHLTIYPIPSEDRKTLYWSARATPSTAHSYIQHTALDPVEALMDVLQRLPKAPKRAAPKDKIDPNRGMHFSDYESRASGVDERPVTAAVIEPSALSGLPAGADPLDLHGGRAADEWEKFR